MDAVAALNEIAFWLERELAPTTCKVQAFRRAAVTVSALSGDELAARVAAGQLDFLQYGAAPATANGVPAERITTTWPAAKLLDWARPTTSDQAGAEHALT